MPIFDVVLLVIIGSFSLFGLWFGLVDTIISLVGTVIGVYFASRYYETVSNWIQSITGWGGNLAKVVIFILALRIITRLVGLAFWLLKKVIHLFTRLPVIRGFDRLLGLAFGLVEGLAVVGMSLFFISRFPLGENFMRWFGDSHFAPLLVKTASIYWPLLPEAIRLLKSTVEGII